MPPPRLEDVRPEDLIDTDRLTELHRQAGTRGLVGISEADRLKFAAAVEHARAVGRRNPCGLFARIVARGWWSFATLEEEERAARRLRQQSRGETPGRSEPAQRADAEPVPAAVSSLGEVLGRLGIGAGRAVPAAIGSLGREMMKTSAMSAAVQASGARRRTAGFGDGGGTAGPNQDRPVIRGEAEAAMLARLGRLAGSLRASPRPD